MGIQLFFLLAVCFASGPSKQRESENIQVVELLEESGAMKRVIPDSFVSHQPSLRFTLRQVSQKGLSPPFFARKKTTDELEVVLERNENLISPSYKYIEMGEEEKKTEVTLGGEWNCYYQGHVTMGGAKVEGAVVAASTCEGLRGVIISQGQFWTIEPSLEKGDSYVIFEEKMEKSGETENDSDQWCGSDDLGSPPGKKSHSHSHINSGFDSKRRVVGCSDVQIVIVNDYARFRTQGTNTQAQTFSIFNTAAAIYAATAFSPCLQLVLAGQLTYTTSDPWFTHRCNDIHPTVGLTGCWRGGLLRSTNGYEIDSGYLLDGHTSWWLSYEADLQALFNQDLDVSHLFSANNFDSSTVGLAWVGTVCSTFMTGVNQMTLTATNNARVFAHELGHNFAMNHTSGVMAASTGSATSSFVQISIDQANAAMVSQTCFTPNSGVNMTLDEFCGNGIIEGCEECDPGTEVTDTCCVNCQINRPTCECANTQPCCLNGAFRSSSAVCRPASNSQCDTAEMCTGTSGNCPVDVYDYPDKNCTDLYGFNGTCFGGNCQPSLTTQCRLMSSQYPNDVGCVNSNCGRLYCTLNTTGPSCPGYWVSSPQDGSPCAASSYCSAGTCQPLSFFVSYAAENPIPPAAVCTSSHSISSTHTRSSLSGPTPSRSRSRTREITQTESALLPTRTNSRTASRSSYLTRICGDVIGPVTSPIFVAPVRSGSYSNNMSCVWTLQAPVNCEVRVTLQMMNIASGDFLSIFQGALNTGTMLYRWSGTAYPGMTVFQTKAKQRLMTLQFVSDGSVVAGGFRAKAEAMCTGLPATPTYYIGSTIPSGITNFTLKAVEAGLYPPSANSVWNIFANTGCTIQARIASVNISTGDGLSLYTRKNAATPRSSILAFMFQGATIPVPNAVKSTGTGMQILFQSDAALTTRSSGFTLVVNNVCPIGAVTTFYLGDTVPLVSSAVTLRTTAIGLYPPNTNFTWTLTANVGCEARLVLTSYGSESLHDYLSIWNVATPTNGMMLSAWSGNSLPVTSSTFKSSNGRSLIVRFISDGDGNKGSGFVGTVSQVCPAVTPVTFYAGQAVPSTALTFKLKPVEGGYYPANYAWAWTKTYASGCARLTFTFLDTNAGVDLIVVRNGPLSTSPLLRTVSGTTLPTAISTTQRSIFVRFSSQNGTPRRGFNATVQSVAC